MDRATGKDIVETRRRGESAVGTSIERKALIAASGIVLYGYVVVHMLGNLEVFGGPMAFDGYHEFLRSLGEPVLRRGWFLWLVRPLLAASFVVHVALAARHSNDARRARGGAARRQAVTGYATSSMRVGGIVLLAFVVFHVLHLTAGVATPAPFEYGRAYANTVGALRVGWVSGAYLLAIGALGLHLRHGVWSAAQSLGLTVGRDTAMRRVATGSAVLVGAGFASVPLAVLAGILR